VIPRLSISIKYAIHSGPRTGWWNYDSQIGLDQADNVLINHIPIFKFRLKCQSAWSETFRIRERIVESAWARFLSRKAFDNERCRWTMRRCRADSFSHAISDYLLSSEESECRKVASVVKAETCNAPTTYLMPPRRLRLFARPSRTRPPGSSGTLLVGGCDAEAHWKLDKLKR